MSTETLLEKKLEKNSTNYDIGRISRHEYDEMKRRVIKNDDNNFQFIIVVPTNGDKGWCDIPERSALFYKYYISDKLALPADLHSDMDSFYDQYKIGMIRTRGFNSVRRRIQNSGYYDSETVEGKTVIFKLNKKFTAQEVREMKDRLHAERLAMNAIVTVKPIDPGLYQRMLNLGTRLHKICFRRLDKLTSETNGKRIVELIDAMIREYHFFCANRKQTTEQKADFYKQMRQYAEALLIELQMLASLDLWRRVDCISLGEEVKEIYERIESHLASTVRKMEKNGEK